MTKSKHDEGVRQLWLRPERAGLEDVVISAKEVRMLRRDRQIGAVDNVYWTKNGDLYLLEHKSNPHPPAKTDAYALVQLTRARLHFYEYLSMLGTMLYSRGDDVEVIE